MTIAFSEIEATQAVSNIFHTEKSTHLASVRHSCAENQNRVQTLSVGTELWLPTDDHPNDSLSLKRWLAVKNRRE